MLALDTRVCPNVADVAAKVIDGEAIIMNLSNGLYFSMDQVGAVIWELLEAGHSLEEMAEALEHRFNVDRDRATGDVTRLVSELLAENLVEVNVEGRPKDQRPDGAAGHAEYVSPVLNKYSDMADLLALDPPMPGLRDYPPE